MTTPLTTNPDWQVQARKDAAFEAIAKLLSTHYDEAAAEMFAREYITEIEELLVIMGGTK